MIIDIFYNVCKNLQYHPTNWLVSYFGFNIMRNNFRNSLNFNYSMFSENNATNLNLGSCFKSHWVLY